MAEGVVLHLRSRQGEAFLEVTHKVDFRHVWEAWHKQRSEGGEVVVHVDGPGGVRPRLTVYLAPAGSSANVYAPDFRWRDDEEERRALSPIQTWTWDAP